MSEDSRRFDDRVEEEKQLDGFCRDNCDHVNSFGCDSRDFCLAKIHAFNVGEDEPIEADYF